MSDFIAGLTPSSVPSQLSLTGVAQPPGGAVTRSVQSQRGSSVEPCPRYEIVQVDAVRFLAGLADESVDLVLTDPAYESLEKHRAIGTTTRLKHSKSSSNDWFQIFPNARFPELLREVYRVLKRNRHFYLFSDQETMFVVKPIAEAAGFRFWKPLVWDKCLGPQTPIWTDRGVVHAENVLEGDRVATPDGQLVHVFATRRTSSPAVIVRLSNGLSITASEDHRFALANGELREASSLKHGDELRSAAVRAQDEVKVLRLEDLVDDASRVLEMPDPTTCLFCAELALDYDLGRLVGLYAAEGHRTETYVSFALHADEKTLAAFIGRFARSLGMRASVRDHGEHGAVVTVGHSMLSRIIGAFVGGERAPIKFFKPLVYAAPDEFRRGVLAGLLEGDGHWSHDEQRETLNIASLDLACFAYRMVCEQGRHASLSRFENQYSGGYRVRFDPNNPVRPISVVSLEHIGQTELVDIAIDHPEQLYLLGDGAVTHNCKIGMGYHYRSRYEFVLFFEKGKRRLSDLSVPDVIEQASVRAGYPTEKPVALSKLVIRQSTIAGELVVDPFMGSASTGAASLSLSRSFLGCDISPAALVAAAARLGQFEGARDVALHRAVTREGARP